MKKRLVAAAIAAMLCTATAHAQWVVIDPTNLVQNTMTAIRTLEQINNQIRQLQNEAQMLMNQARNLASLPSSVVGQLRANLATTERLIAQARGLAYDVTNLDREFRSEEHTSELQSQSNLVCRLLLEKKKTTKSRYDHRRPSPSQII